MAHVIDKSGWCDRLLELDYILFGAAREQRRLKTEQERIARKERGRVRPLPPERRIEISQHAACMRWYGHYDRMPCCYCRSTNTHYNGHRNGRPRARCRDCQRSWYVESERKAA